MLVKATRLGFYGNTRVQSGASFTLNNPKDFSEKWMEKLEEPKKRRKSKEKSVSEKGKEVVKKVEKKQPETKTTVLPK